MNEDAHTSPVDLLLAQAYFDYSLNGILVTDGDGTVFRANAAAASILGVERRRLLGARFPSFAGMPAAPVDRHRKLLAEQGIARCDLSYHRPDNSCSTIALESIVVAEDTQLHIVDDVTDARESAARLETARAEAESANTAKSRFLAQVSHELRTPLNGILGLGGLVAARTTDHQTREYLQRILQSASTLRQVIDDLLDHARLEAGRIEFESRPLDLFELLDELSLLSRASQRSERCELIFHIDRRTPRYVIGDRLRLGQILNNLLGNAIKFTPAGSVVLQLAPDANALDQLCIEVIDTGIGMDEQALTGLFEPFSQAGAEIARRFGGSGLGMAIARELTEGLGGSLNVSSRPGQGTHFRLRLPLPPADAPAEHVPEDHVHTENPTRAFLKLAPGPKRDAIVEILAAIGVAATDAESDADVVIAQHRAPTGESLTLEYRKESVLPLTLEEPLTPGGLSRALRRTDGDATGDADEWATAPEDYAGARVLLVEDNEINTLVLTDLLTQGGVTVQHAGDGAAAVSCVMSDPQGFDLILMDVQMPVLDGLGATQQLRSQGYRGPIVGVSAGVAADEVAACETAGMNDFLGKPIDPDALWGCFARWVTPRDDVPSRPDVVAQPDAGLRPEQQTALQRRFLDVHGDDATTVARHLEHGERERAAAVLHTLRGAAGAVGAAEIVTLTRQLEQVLTDDRDPTSQAQGLIQSLAEALDAARSD